MGLGATLPTSYPSTPKGWEADQLPGEALTCLSEGNRCKPLRSWHALGHSDWLQGGQSVSSSGNL